MSTDDRTPGHVLADEAGWYWETGPQYQAECERIAAAVVKAERERLLTRIKETIAHPTPQLCDLIDELWSGA